MPPPGHARPPGEPRQGRPASPRHLLGVLLFTLITGSALLGLTAPLAAAASLPSTGSPASAGLPASAGFAASAGLPAPTAPSTQLPPGEDEEELPVNGTLRDREGDPLPDVRVEAFDAGGDKVNEAFSDERGRWELTVPEPGTYTFRVDENSLPEGVQVLQGEVVRDVDEGRLSVVVFRFGEERTGLDSGPLAQTLRMLVDGVRFGLVIGITAVGLSLIFGTTGLVNFAHGEMVTIGAFVAWTINVTLGMHLIPATLVAIVAGGILGALYNLGIFRQMRDRHVSLIAQLVAAIGLAIALRYIVLILYDGRSRAFADYASQVERDYGLIRITDRDLATIVISLAVLVGIALLLQRTRIGKAIRAVADNRDLAAASGVDVERIVLYVWILGGGLAALGGVLFGLSELGGTVWYEMGFNLLLLMFAGVILGGLGTAYGALVGCLLVGILVQASAEVIPVDLKYLGGLLVLILILVVRPQGLLGSRARIG